MNLRGFRRREYWAANSLHVRPPAVGDVVHFEGCVLHVAAIHDDVAELREGPLRLRWTGEGWVRA